MKQLLQVLRYQNTFQTAVNRAALSHNSIDLFEELHQRFQQKKSTHEIDRLDRIEILNGLSFDVTHPPTSYRIAMIDKLNYEPSVIISDEKFLKIRTELDQFREKAKLEIVDRFMAGLFR